MKEKIILKFRKDIEVPLEVEFEIIPGEKESSHCPGVGDEVEISSATVLDTVHDEKGRFVAIRGHQFDFDRLSIYEGETFISDLLDKAKRSDSYCD